MNQGNNTRATSRAQRLRHLAGQAENLGARAILADAQIAGAVADLATLAAAAKSVAAELERLADGEAVTL